MKRVIIIGAGAAGLAAASKLVGLGFSTQNITILEAQNRIGGRIHSIEEGILTPLVCYFLFEFYNEMWMIINLNSRD